MARQRVPLPHTSEDQYHANAHATRCLAFAVAAAILLSSMALAQQTDAGDASHTWIERGNNAWIAGMKSGDAQLIADTYAEEALDCAATGECIRGKRAILEHLKQRAAQLGRAEAASVTSGGSVRRGDYVYEWGVAQASFANAHTVKGRYLTVWQLQADGSWKIFRNMAIPADAQK